MIAIYPGSFDPITLGHLDIIQRGCKLFERVIVAVLRNPDKSPLFTLQQRVDQIQRCTQHLPNVEVDSFNGLTVEYARLRDAKVLLRGLRVLSDFEKELQMAHINQTLWDEIETVFLAASNEYSFLSSSVVKEIARFGGSVDHLVPQQVALEIYQCYTETHPGATPPDRNEPVIPNEPPASGLRGVDIQRELNRLEELLFDGLHIPLTKRTLVDEETFLAQLDSIRENLPPAFSEAEKIVHQREEILLHAEEYAQEIMEAAERRADQILDEMGIIQQAELEANQIRKRVQQECEAIQEQTLAEIERMRLQAQQELEQMRQMALADCEDIQNGADEYADAVLNSIEQQLTEMLRVIHNGRQQLQGEPLSDYPDETEPPGTSTLRTAQPPPKKG